MRVVENKHSTEIGAHVTVSRILEKEGLYFRRFVSCRQAEEAEEIQSRSSARSQQPPCLSAAGCEQRIGRGVIHEPVVVDVVDVLDVVVGLVQPGSSGAR